jgi:PA14 domain/Bacterial Ig domain/Secretion system C-terminal sorting domain
MNKKFIFVIIIFIVLFFISEASVRRSFQPPQNYTGADGSNCSQCHGNFNNGGGSVSTNGLPDQNFLAGQSYDFALSIVHPDVRARWGFSITARDANNQPVGTFVSSNPNAALNGVGELSHLNAVFQTGINYTYSNLRWTAPANPTPAQQVVKFYYTANAANGDGGTNGDFIYSAIKTTSLLVLNKKPLVSITNPVNNSVIGAGTTINLTAVASDSDGVVTNVQFYNNLFKFLTDSTSPYGLSSNEAEPGNYTLTARAFDTSGDSTISDTVRFTITGCTPAGAIRGEGYTNITGTQVADLLNNPSYPNNPSVTVQLPSLEYGTVGDNYGARLSGYLCAPETGGYTFYIAGDDQAGLWLSTNDNPANKVLIAYNEFPVTFRTFTTFPTQKSATIRLVKGARYYIETLHKQSTQNNHLTVAWIKPDGSSDLALPGSYLSPISGSSGNNSTITANDFKEAFQQIKKLKVTVAPNPSNNYFTLNISGGSNERVTVIVRDVAGRVIKTIYNESANTNIKLGSDLASGIYFAEIMQGKERKTLKLVKE